MIQALNALLFTLTRCRDTVPSFPKQVVLIFIMSRSHDKLFCSTWCNEPEYRKKKKNQERKRLNYANRLSSGAAKRAKIFWQENPCVTGQGAALGGGGGRRRSQLRQVGSGGGMERPLSAPSAPCACHHPNAVATLRPLHLEGWKAGRRMERDGWAKNAEFIQWRAVVTPRNSLSAVPPSSFS